MMMAIIRLFRATGKTSLWIIIIDDQTINNLNAQGGRGALGQQVHRRGYGGTDREHQVKAEGG